MANCPRNPHRERRIDDTAEIRDRGSVLPMVLVLSVIGMLVVLPMLSYAIAITKTNNILVEKTERVEAARAGLRTALADPTGIYQLCGTGGALIGVDLPTVPLDVSTSSECFFIDSATADDPSTLRAGNAVTLAGAPTSTDMKGAWLAQSGSNIESEWLAEATVEPEQDKVWLPSLPAHALDPRSALPFPMPGGNCDVYFPGTYYDVLTIDGPVHFMSGIYYFENEVRVVDGADAVVGEGAIGSCTTDQEAAFDAIGAPITHNSTGKGVTFVFGGAGRLVIDDSGAGDLAFFFNQRYVGTNETTVLSSAGVSIMTVNGDASTPAGSLQVPGVIDVPMSLAGEDGTELATTQSYSPSTATVIPDPPSEPRNVDTDRFLGSLRVEWDEPAATGGADIERYVATASPGGAQCTTDGWTHCVLEGLNSSTNYTVTVTASHVGGDSAPSAASSPRRPNGGPANMPDSPNNVTSAGHDGAVVVSWDEPDDNGSTIVRYRAEAGAEFCETIRPDETSCTISGLANGTPTTVLVTAINAIAPSIPSSPATATPSAANGPAPVSPGWASTMTPVVDISLSGDGASSVFIPGYVSVPMGRIKIDNPTGQQVEMSGGMLAAVVDIDDSRAGDPDPDVFKVGFVNAVVQRKFKIVTTAAADGGTSTATAVVQINEGGGWAVNAWEIS